MADYDHADAYISLPCPIPEECPLIHRHTKAAEVDAQYATVLWKQMRQSWRFSVLGVFRDLMATQKCVLSKYGHP